MYCTCIHVEVPTCLLCVRASSWVCSCACSVVIHVHVCVLSGIMYIMWPALGKRVFLYTKIAASATHGANLDLATGENYRPSSTFSLRSNAYPPLVALTVSLESLEVWFHSYGCRVCLWVSTIRVCVYVCTCTCTCIQVYMLYLYHRSLTDQRYSSQYKSSKNSCPKNNSIVWAHKYSYRGVCTAIHSHVVYAALTQHGIHHDMYNYRRIWRAGANQPVVLAVRFVRSL